MQEMLRPHPDVLVLSQSADYSTKTIRLTLAGERLPDAAIQAMQMRLPEFGFSDADLVVVQSGQSMPDIGAFKKDILQDFIQSNRTENMEREARIATLQKELEDSRKAAANQLPLQAIYREIAAQFPQAEQITVTSGYRARTTPAGGSTDSGLERPILLVQLNLTEPLSTPERQRLRLGLSARAGLKSVDDVQLEVTKSPSPKRGAKAANRQ
jgi:hypothetical protein